MKSFHDIATELQALRPATPECHAIPMRAAIEQARMAFQAGEFPVGAVVVQNGKIISAAHNEREASNDPTAHAEVLAIRRAARQLMRWRLNDCALYVTLEPCPMCAGAAVMARLNHIYFGAYDVQRGCCGSVYRIAEDAGFNHAAPSTGGVLEAECAELSAQFLALHRN